MELSSPLTLEMLGKPFLLEKRIELLHAIEEHGSISKAAKAVPMSYKSAWEAVDVMNTLSPEPIVSRETGGKDGGGTTITAYGLTLLENYAVLKEEVLKSLTKLEDVLTKSGSKNRPEYRNMMKFIRESTALLFPKDREDIRKIFNPDGEN